MTIRKIITSAAIAAVLGLAGGSAYADDSDSYVDDQAFTVSADASADGFEQARLPEETLETLNIN